MNPDQKRRETNKVTLIVFVVVVLIIFATSMGGSFQNASQNKNTTSLNTKTTNSQKDSNMNLDASVRMVVSPFPGIEVINNEKVDWKDCTFELNDKYKRTDKISFEGGGGDPFTILYSQFIADDGERFNFETTAPKKFWIYCEVGGESRLGGYSF